MKWRNSGRSGTRGGLLGISLALGVLTLTAVAYAVELLTVTTRETSIKKEKKLLGGTKLATVVEGDLVTLIDAEDSWYKVEFKGVQGWLPKTAVSTDRDVVLSDKAVSGGVIATEQSKGGRGFNPEVEKEFRASRADLDAAYKLLDKILERKFPEESVARFLSDGKLGEQVADAPAPAGSSSAVSAQKGRAAPPWKQ